MFRPAPKTPYRRRKPNRRKRNNFSKKVREEILERDEGLCQQCGAEGTEIHHVRFRSQNGRGVATNGVLLCYTCHTKVHQNRDLALQWQKHYESYYGKDYYKDEWDREDNK